MYDTDRTTVQGPPSSGSCTVSYKGIEWGEKFIAFHNKNPQVYEALVQYAYQWKNETGLDKIGLGLLWERVRWDLTLAIATNQRSSQEYRLNDGFKSYYSRLMMMREPSLRECFDLRRSEAGTFLAENLHRCK